VPVNTPALRRSAIWNWLQALRLHQWSKNLLIFLPAIGAHRILEASTLLSVGLAFLWFGLCASGTYVINDLLDVESDRAHPRKRLRPFASGALSLLTGKLTAAALIPMAFAGAMLTLGALFTAALGLYLVGTLWYSIALKRIAMVDVLSLAGLYTLRLIAGAAAAAAIPSFWLLAFSMFMFLGLAIIKRYTELRWLLSSGPGKAAGRGYTTDDLPLLLACGTSSCFVSILVLALYVNDGTAQMYRHPEALWLLCPLVLYWILRVWRKSFRGELHDDPVVFALRDRPSMVVGVLCMLLLWLAT
jgi:4-hydroxybenzoate polyprenyltransferase